MHISSVMWFSALCPLCCVDPLGRAVFSTLAPRLCRAYDLKQTALCTKQDITENNPLQPKHTLTFGTKFPLHSVWSRIWYFIVLRFPFLFFSFLRASFVFLKSVTRCWQEDELWKQLRQLACFLCCPRPLQLHYMLTYCKWHCATHLWFTGTELCAWVACLESALQLSPTFNDFQNLNAAKYFHLNKSPSRAVARQGERWLGRFFEKCETRWAVCAGCLFTCSLKARLFILDSWRLMFTQLQSATWTRTRVCFGSASSENLNVVF